MAQHCQAILFDLDNCICDSREPGEALFAPAFDAIARANAGHLPPERLQAAFEECWYSSFDLVAQRYGFTPAMFDAGFEAFARLEVARPLKGYPDLAVLPRLAVDKHLVTSGFQRLQQSKVRALGIADRFASVVIDAVDVPPRRGKRRIFEDILAERGLRAQQVLVVGDNPLSELEAGRALGMTTVQTLRPGVKKAEADVHIRSFEELLALVGPPA